MEGQIIYKDFKKPIFKKKVKDVGELEDAFDDLRKKLR